MVAKARMHHDAAKRTNETLVQGLNTEQLLQTAVANLTQVTADGKTVAEAQAELARKLHSGGK